MIFQFCRYIFAKWLITVALRIRRQTQFLRYGKKAGRNLLFDINLKTETVRVNNFYKTYNFECFILQRGILFIVRGNSDFNTTETRGRFMCTMMQ